MQITIDAGLANPTHLRLTAAMLTWIAAYKENPATAGMPLPPTAQMTGAAPAASGDQAPQGDSTGSETGSAGASDETALLDSAGEKWNGDIHTANQSKNTDGTWRRKRTAKGSETPATRPVDPPAPTTPVPPPPASGPSVAVPPAPQVPPAPNAVPPAPAAPAADSVASQSPVLVEFGGDNFGALVKYATSIVGSKKISTDQLLATCVEVGVPDLHACSKAENAHLVPVLAEALAKRVAK